MLLSLYKPTLLAYCTFNDWLYKGGAKYFIFPGILSDIKCMDEPTRTTSLPFVIIPSFE